MVIKVNKYKSLVDAVDAFLSNLRDRYPGEEFYCPFVRKVDEELRKIKNEPKVPEVS